MAETVSHRRELERVVRVWHEGVVLDTVQHPLLCHGLSAARLPDTDGGVVGARAQFSSSTRYQLSQLIPGSFAMTADIDRTNLCKHQTECKA